MSVTLQILILVLYATDVHTLMFGNIRNLWTQKYIFQVKKDLGDLGDRRGGTKKSGAELFEEICAKVKDVSDEDYKNTEKSDDDKSMREIMNVEIVSYFENFERFMYYDENYEDHYDERYEHCYDDRYTYDDDRYEFDDRYYYND